MFCPYWRLNYWTHVHPPDQVLHALTKERVKWALCGNEASKVFVLRQVVSGQTDMSGKTYHVGVTNVEDLTPHLPLLVSLPIVMFQPGIEPMSSWWGVRCSLQRANYPMEIVWMPAWQCTLFLPFFEVSRFSQLPAVASYWFWELADVSHIELIGHFRQPPLHGYLFNFNSHLWMVVNVINQTTMATDHVKKYTFM